MGGRRVVVLTGILVLVVVSACDVPPQELAVGEAVAPQVTQSPEVRDSRAEATVDALSVQAQAQAIEATATAMAWSFEATATAVAREVEATATATAREAEAQAVAQAATATAVALDAQATAQAVAATATAVALEMRRQEAVQPLRTYTPWLLLGLAMGGMGYLFARLVPVVEARARVIRRRPDEGEPIIVWQERWALPLRAFGPLVDATPGRERAPQLAPTVAAQEATTMRQQTANALQARQVGAVARAKHKAPFLVKGTVGRRPRPRLERNHRLERNQGPIPGLVKVVAVKRLSEATEQGILPPRLAEAIEGQWREVTDEEVEQDGRRA